MEILPPSSCCISLETKPPSKIASTVKAWGSMQICRPTLASSSQFAAEPRDRVLAGEKGAVECICHRRGDIMVMEVLSRLKLAEGDVVVKHASGKSLRCSGCQGRWVDCSAG